MGGPRLPRSWISEEHMRSGLQSSGLHGRARARGGAGFTLLDVLLALMMFMLGAVGLLSMHLSSLDANVRARELQEATQLCQDKVEQLRLVPLPLPAPPSGGEALDSRGCLV